MALCQLNLNKKVNKFVSVSQSFKKNLQPNLHACLAKSVLDNMHVQLSLSCIIGVAAV